MAFAVDQYRVACRDASLGGSILITLDREQQERVVDAVTALHAAEALAKLA